MSYPAAPALGTPDQTPYRTTKPCTNSNSSNARKLQAPVPVPMLPGLHSALLLSMFVRTIQVLVFRRWGTTASHPVRTLMRPETALSAATLLAFPRVSCPIHHHHRQANLSRPHRPRRIPRAVRHSLREHRINRCANRSRSRSARSCTRHSHHRLYAHQTITTRRISRRRASSSNSNSRLAEAQAAAALTAAAPMALTFTNRVHPQDWPHHTHQGMR